MIFGFFLSTELSQRESLNVQATFPLPDPMSEKNVPIAKQKKPKHENLSKTVFGKPRNTANHER